MPLVSIIVPTYNRSDYLRLALESVRHQTFRDFEVIVQDNGSEAVSSAVVATFPDLAIRYFSNDHNIGQTANITLAISRAEGKYVAILADDDFWEDDFLATLVPPLEARPECILAFANYGLIDGKGNQLPETSINDISQYSGNHLLSTGYHDNLEQVGLVYRAIAFISGCVFRRDATDWTKVPKELEIGIDVYLIYLAARVAKTFYFDPKRLFNIRWHVGTLTSATQRNDAAGVSNCRSHIFLWNKVLADPAMRCKRYYFLQRSLWTILLILHYLRTKAWRMARTETWNAISGGVLSPRVPVYHIGFLANLRWIGIRRKFMP